MMACPDQFIVQVKMDQFYCIMCNCELNGHDAILDHLCQESHEIAVVNYGKDIQIVRGDHQYYCSLCNSLISGYINVHNHLNGRKHNNYLTGHSWIAGEEKEEEEEEEEEFGEFFEGDEDAEYFDEDEDAVCFDEDEDEDYDEEKDEWLD